MKSEHTSTSSASSSGEIDNLVGANSIAANTTKNAGPHLNQNISLSDEQKLQQVGKYYFFLMFLISVFKLNSTN